MGQYDVNDKKVEYGENLIKISVPPIMFLILHEVWLLFLPKHLWSLQLIKWICITGPEPLLPFPSLHCDSVVGAVLLEVCGGHRHHVGDRRHRQRVGDETGELFLDPTTEKWYFILYSLSLHHSKTETSGTKWSPNRRSTSCATAKVSYV